MEGRAPDVLRADHPPDDEVHVVGEHAGAAGNEGARARHAHRNGEVRTTRQEGRMTGCQPSQVSTGRGQMDTLDADVIVVGAGPTGLMLAGELRLAGLSAVVGGKLTRPMRESPARGFSARTHDGLDPPGLLSEVGELE